MTRKLRPAAETIKAARQVAENGGTTQDVADALGVTRDAVYIALKRAGESELIDALHVKYPIRHGTATGYNRGCRCSECRSENASTHRRQTSRRASLPPDQIPHGASARTNYQCNCDVCVTADRERQRRYRQVARGERAAGRRKWTAEELAAITERSPDGRYTRTARDLALVLGHTPASIHSKRWALRHQGGAA